MYSETKTKAILDELCRIGHAEREGDSYRLTEAGRRHAAEAIQSPFESADKPPADEVIFYVHQPEDDEFLDVVREVLVGDQGIMEQHIVASVLIDDEPTLAITDWSLFVGLAYLAKGLIELGVDIEAQIKERLYQRGIVCDPHKSSILNRVRQFKSRLDSSQI